MSAPRCSACSKTMVRNGKTSAGKQRWKCPACSATRTNSINSDAKQLDEFLRWLTGKKTQGELSGSARTFRRRSSKFWRYWALPPLVDEVHRVVYVDGIHLGRKAVVLIACSDEHVLGWYLARTEHSGAWANLLRRIAPPDVVVSDGGQGFQKALKRVWPETELQRCTYHAFTQVRRYTTSKPRLPAGTELLDIARDLLSVRTDEEAAAWVASYLAWTHKWGGFLEERSCVDGRSFFTHERLRKARGSLSRLVNSGHLFTYLDPLLTIGGELPATNNRIEGWVNAGLREMLRNHRGLSLLRRIKAVFWWCYLHTECPLGAADILRTMPTDDDIGEIYRRLTGRDRQWSDIPQWGDAVMWGDLHRIDYNHDLFRHDWD